MGHFKHAAVLAAGLAAMFMAAPVLAADSMTSLQSFGASRAISTYELSASGVSGGAVQPAIEALLSGSTLRNDTVSPFLSAVTAPYLALANGGRYAGVTYVPADNLRVRLGAAVNDERLDRFRFDAGAPVGPLALTYDASQSRSLLGGLSFDLSNALGVDLTAIASQHSGLPLGFSRDAAIAPKSNTAALGVSAHMDFGQGWVTTASFNEGLTQLDPRAGLGGGTLREQAYSVAIAKRGVFGDDALGLSFSRPAPSMAGSLSSLSASGDVPLTVAQSVPLGRAQETDIQLGYVTNFLDGAVALQTNAGYQTNAQGQPGATSVSLQSRAKIKF
jgi:hypothetical protein